MSATKVLKMIKDNGTKYVDLRFTDTIGKEQHVTLPSGEISSDFFKAGKMVPAFERAAFALQELRRDAAIKDRPGQGRIHRYLRQVVVRVARCPYRQVWIWRNGKARSLPPALAGSAR